MNFIIFLCVTLNLFLSFVFVLAPHPGDVTAVLSRAIRRQRVRSMWRNRACACQKRAVSLWPPAGVFFSTVYMITNVTWLINIHWMTYARTTALMVRVPISILSRPTALQCQCRSCNHIDARSILPPFLLLFRYVPNVAKEEYMRSV